MKEIRITWLLLAITTVTCINADNSFYSLALKEARTSNKLILLDFMAPWCGGCKAYEKYIFGDSLTLSTIESKFIILKIDKENPEMRSLVEKFEIHGLPHIVIIDASEKIFGSLLGFDGDYVNNPGAFITRLKNIINSQEEVRKLELDFKSDTTNIEAITELLLAYKNVGHFFGIKRLTNLLLSLDPTPDRLFEYKYNHAIHSIKNEMDPEPLLSFIQEYPTLNEKYAWGANSQLLYYFEKIGDLDNTDLYYRKLLNIDSRYFKKKYVDFLFENNYKIDTAIILTNECLEHDYIRNDFWGPYLSAHSLTYKGSLERAVQDYSAWMVEHESLWLTDDSYWPLYFYAKFANVHLTDLERALEYISIAEANRNMKEEKLLMAEILFKLGQNADAIGKLRECLDRIDDRNEYERILGLIDQYK